MRRKHSLLPSLLRGLLLPVIAAAALLCFAMAVNNLDGGRQLEESLRRGCVACYAAEGVYPPTLSYLEEHYGLQIDEERYTVHYSAFAENLMPDITVLENTP